MNYDQMLKSRLKPVLNSPFVLIGTNPDLSKILKGIQSEPIISTQECVDHHVFLADDGMWHLWGCVRGTAIGRLLYLWKGRSLDIGNWTQTGEYIRASKSAGESIDDWANEEWLQSPFIVRQDKKYYMFYGGHATGSLEQPNLLTANFRKTDCQICLMISDDGLSWRRFANEEGKSRVFTGPGETRDPCLLKLDNKWLMYYAGYEFVNGEELPAVYARESEDLINWSEYRLVHRIRSNRFGGHNWDTECPHVVKRGDLFYLFRTENYLKARTHVFCSTDPFDFGIDALDENCYLGVLPVSAPEIIISADGQEYITSNHDLKNGTRICRLKWLKYEPV